MVKDNCLLQETSFMGRAEVKGEEVLVRGSMGRSLEKGGGRGSRGEGGGC